ncbi:hypothetical protein B4144_2146 [Bacillus atrophaeus]|nr:hypothetical protein B4144_2146 [Bacillus atrophaeus]
MDNEKRRKIGFVMDGIRSKFDQSHYLEQFLIHQQELHFIEQG